MYNRQWQHLGRRSMARRARREEFAGQQDEAESANQHQGVIDDLAQFAVAMRAELSGISTLWPA